MPRSISSPNPRTLDPNPPSSSPNDDGSNQDSQDPDPDPPEGDIGSSQDLEDPKDEDDDEDDEEGECGFCLFMKGGGCKDEFLAWEKCFEDAEKSGDDVVDRCFEMTALLKRCMDAHADYYKPILSAEKSMADLSSEEAEKDLKVAELES